MARGWTGFEVFRNPASERELPTCIAKGIDLEGELLRKARRKGLPLSTVDPPTLWVITPSLSPDLRQRFGLLPSPGWPPGFLSPAAGWGLAVVVVRDVPPTPETLFLRLLGRGDVQDQAFAEIGALPLNHSLRKPTLERVVHFLEVAQESAHPTAEQQEFAMKTYPYLDALEKKGKAEGKAEAKAEDVVVVLETRGLKVSAAVRKKIRACTEIAQLHRLLGRAVLVKSTRELFE